jgi:hypothetical protein
MNKTLYNVMMVLFYIVGIWFVFWLLIESDKTPVAPPNTAVIYEDKEEYAQTHKVIQVDATDNYIYLNHGQVISVFDWKGEYCFSIVTYNPGNGLATIYCVGNELFLVDKKFNVFRYVGRELIENYSIRHGDQYGTFTDQMREKKNNLVSLKGYKIVDMDGNVILEHKEHWNPLEIVTALLTFFVFFESLFEAYRKRQKEKEGRLLE